MPYSVYFANKDNLYIEFRLDSMRKAKSRLEKIANIFSTSGPALGNIHFFNDYLERDSFYTITYNGKEAVLKYKSTKKNFFNESKRASPSSAML